MAGYQGTSTRRLAHEALAAAIEAERREINTTLDGTIVAYDEQTQLASVQPTLERRFGDKVLRAPVLKKIKLVQPKAGGHGIHVSPKVGDPVVLHARQRSVDRSQTRDATDTSAAPARMHNLSDCIATPGCGPDSNKMAGMRTNGAHFGKADGKTGYQSRDDGSSAIVGGGEGGDRLIIDPAGKFDINGPGGADSLMEWLRDFITMIKTHTHAGVPMDPAFVSSADVLLTRLNAMKAGG